MSTVFESYLNKFGESDWLSSVETLLSEVHPVDRNAVQIWFRFFPLDLFRHLQAAEDKEKAIHGFALLGNWELSSQVDISHAFLYGHRYWKAVKAAIEAEMVTFKDANTDLATEIREIAGMVAEKLKVDVSLVIGITAVGLMTLVQAGSEDFKAAPGEVEKASSLMAKKPDQIVSERAKDDSQGVLGFLKTINKKFSITYTESRNGGKFRIMNDQEIAGASAQDRSQEWKKRDDRCWEGVVPVECLAAACGTCWVGVLSGQEKLSNVARRERRQMKVFGYNQPEDEKPFLRLACQAKALGNATIVIPPWNGVFGKKIYGNVEELELYPATTSARALRETIETATAKD